MTKKYIDAEKLIAEIERLKSVLTDPLCSQGNILGPDWVAGGNKMLNEISSAISALQQEQPEERPEYGYLSTEYVPGRKPRWSVGDVLAYYVCTSNEEGEYPLGKIVNVEFDEEEEGWIYTFEDESMQDEQSLFEEEVYKKN